MHCVSMRSPAMRPQADPTYVYEWPSKTEASVAPPSEIWAKGRSSASAMPLRQSVVLPFPGGPWMPRTSDCESGLEIHWQRTWTIFSLGSSWPNTEACRAFSALSRYERTTAFPWAEAHDGALQLAERQGEHAIDP